MMSSLCSSMLHVIAPALATCHFFPGAWPVCSCKWHMYFKFPIIRFVFHGCRQFMHTCTPVTPYPATWCECRSYYWWQEASQVSKSNETPSRCLTATRVWATRVFVPVQGSTSNCSSKCQLLTNHMHHSFLVCMCVCKLIHISNDNRQNTRLVRIQASAPVCLCS